jgi:hypothetical protein
MKTPQVAAMPGMTALGLNPRSRDQRTVAERKWTAPLKAPAEQKPCDVGLFGDGAKQMDLIDRLR